MRELQRFEKFFQDTGSPKADMNRKRIPWRKLIEYVRAGRKYYGEKPKLIFGGEFKRADGDEEC